MNLLIFIFSYFHIFSMNQPSYSYLALGDSYTIGESVMLHESFPYQTAQMLRDKGKNFHAPEIIAKTGWTTDELQAAINKYKFQPKYDFVTLLIGVNNQYRGRSADEYAKEFESLLKQAIAFAGNNTNHVIVVSIPDWGVTPFAVGRDKKKIATEIDEFNAINEKISKQYKVQYLGITTGTREAATDESLLASDKLHPSAKEYKRWSTRLTEVILKQLK